jgi:thymidylate synthase
MKQYLDLLRLVLENGEWQENRTGVRTLSYPGAQMRYDLTEGFPAVTVRKLAFKSSVGELIGFLQASDSAKQFRELGCKVWDQNANENQQWLANPFREGEDHLGRVYGVQWRDWQAYKSVDMFNIAVQDKLEAGGWEATETSDATLVVVNSEYLYHKKIDQIADVIEKILFTPQDRRIIFHAWNPAELDEMALPPCHLLYQFHPNPTTRTLSMTLYIRSNDLGLGAPFNVSEAAVLLSLISRLTGYTAKILTIQIGDAHIYENHIEMVNTILERQPLASPKLVINPRIPKCETLVEALVWIDHLRPTDFELEGYEHHEPITAPMAV